MKSNLRTRTRLKMTPYFQFRANVRVLVCLTLTSLIVFGGSAAHAGEIICSSLKGPAPKLKFIWEEDGSSAPVTLQMQRYFPREDRYAGNIESVRLQPRPGGSRFEGSFNAGLNSGEIRKFRAPRDGFFGTTEFRMAGVFRSIKYKCRPTGSEISFVLPRR